LLVTCTNMTFAKLVSGSKNEENSSSSNTVYTLSIPVIVGNLVRNHCKRRLNLETMVHL
jgi:hypothetical protein